MKYWLPAVCGMVCLGLGAGLIGVYGFFVQPLSQEFGVGTAVISAGPVALLLVPGFVAPFVGKLADRLPIRALVLSGVTLSMCSLLAITQAPGLASIGFFFVTFSLGLTLYGPVVVNGLMVKVYPDRSARALAIAAIGISLASAALPPLMGLLMSHLPWRSALACLALGAMLVLWVVALLSLPRGVVESVPTGRAEGSSKLAEDADARIYRSSEFWLIGLCVAMGMSVSLVMAVVYAPHFLEQGYSLKQAGAFLALAGAAGLVGKGSVAWIGDAGAAYAKWIAAGLLIIQVLGFALLYVADSLIGVMAAVSFLGFGAGAFLPMQPYLNSRYFDVAKISQVMGAQMPLFVPFGLVGAPLAGYVFDRTGSYHLVFVGLSVILVLSALLVLRLPRAQGLN